MSERKSVWLATAERAAFPTLAADHSVDVAVIGGGITGLTTALLLQREGARVAVIEAHTIGSGTTGNTTGKITSQHTLTYAELCQKHGESKARLYAEANQQAIEKVAELASEVGVEQLSRAPAFVYTSDPARRPAIEAEHRAALECGLPATLTSDVDLPASVGVEVALRFDDQGLIHPIRYLDGLSRRISSDGGLVFENSRAVGIDETGEHAVVRTEFGRVTADHVVMATLLPFLDIGGFFAKARPSRVYGVAATLNEEPPTGMHISVDSRSRSTRPWHDGERHGIVVVGERHETGHRDAGPGRWGALERWTREHFDVDSFAYRWSSQDFTTADGLPYVGRSPRTARTLVATGFKKWGLTNGTAAAEVLTALVAGRAHPWLSLFDATRIGDAGTVKKLVKDNVHVGKRLVMDRVARLKAESVAELEPGQGAMVRVGGRAVGAYRNPDGDLQAVSITCTHMGCTLAWNGAEESWDCPCHGSRFGTDGAVLDGPATRALDQVDVD